jgi:hypothetical protein
MNDITRTSVRISTAAKKVLDDTVGYLTMTLPKEHRSQQDVLRAALLLAAVEPPPTRFRDKRRDMDRGSHQLMLVLDRPARAALRQLIPGYFLTTSNAVDWALRHKAALLSPYWTVFTSSDRAAFAALLDPPSE